MEFATRADNVYMIDTHMMGFEHYQSCYIVKGKEVVLIDAGMPPALEIVRAGIKAHGFSIQDISKIFVSHCEHPDHAGNVGAFVKENPKIKVFINPIGLEYMTHPEIEAEARAGHAAPDGCQIRQPTSCTTSNFEMLKDGDVFDIGDGEELRIMFTPAHQPSGFVTFEKKNKGLFINDLVGNYFPDCDFNLTLTPPIGYPEGQGRPVEVPKDGYKEVVPGTFRHCRQSRGGLQERAGRYSETTGYRSLVPPRR